MIAEFHRLTRFPIKRGTPLYFFIATNATKYIIRKAKPGDKHTVFAAEDLTTRLALLVPVQSPIDISLAYNFEEKSHE